MRLTIAIDESRFDEAIRLYEKGIPIHSFLYTAIPDASVEEWASTHQEPVYVDVTMLSSKSDSFTPIVDAWGEIGNDETCVVFNLREVLRVLLYGCNVLFLRKNMYMDTTAYLSLVSDALNCVSTEECVKSFIVEVENELELFTLKAAGLNHFLISDRIIKDPIRFKFLDLFI